MTAGRRQSRDREGGRERAKTNHERNERNEVHDQDRKRDNTKQWRIVRVKIHTHNNLEMDTGRDTDQRPDRGGDKHPDSDGDSGGDGHRMRPVAIVALECVCQS